MAMEMLKRVLKKKRFICIAIFSRQIKIFQSISYERTAREILGFFPWKHQSLIKIIYFLEVRKQQMGLLKSS